MLSVVFVPNEIKFLALVNLLSEYSPLESNIRLYYHGICTLKCLLFLPTLNFQTDHLLAQSYYHHHNLVWSFFLVCKQYKYLLMINDYNQALFALDSFQ